MYEVYRHAGEGFKPVSAQELRAAAAQLHAGSSPQQLADLEVVIQSHFKAPTFAALGHGASLLQCCADDPLMLQTLALVSSTVPLSIVRACNFSPSVTSVGCVLLGTCCETLL